MAVFAAQHEFPKNPLNNVTGIVGVGQVRCAASIPAGNPHAGRLLPRGGVPAGGPPAGRRARL
jgi:hypothetical protein